MGTGAFNLGVTGMLVQQNKMAVIGNNIANSQTVAFKANRMTFAEEFIQHSGQFSNGIQEQYGNGVKTNGVTSDWSNGALVDTGNMANLALSGDGFVPVNYGGELFYTRSGDFSLVTGDTPGEFKLMRPNGATLLGVGGDAAISGFDPNSNLALTSLSEVKFINIDPADPKGPTSWEIASNGAVMPRPRLEWANDQEPSAVYNDGTGNFTYKDLLQDSTMTLARYQTWTANYQAATSPNAYVPGCIVLNDTGDPATTSVQARFWDPTNDYYDQVAGKSWTNPSVFTSPVLSRATSGIKMVNGFVGVQRFNNPDSLMREESGMYMRTSMTSVTTNVVTRPGSNGSGSLVQGALENSNVDLVSEFTDMIITQRAFQANSKTITTSDQMLQTVLALL
jgi:flagellar hook protein FlgE